MNKALADSYGNFETFYDELTGNMELPAVTGAPQVVVIAGGGTGTGLFRRLQRSGQPFAAGVLWENDLDYPTAKALAARLVSVPAFAALSVTALAEMRSLIDGAETVICTLKRENMRDLAAELADLLVYAEKQGKLQ